MQKNSTIIYHFAALVTAMLWGSTFVASKVLLNAGLSPAEIMVLRFIIAYLCLLPLCHKHIRAKRLLDEFYFILLGISGGSIYFLAENTAVQITSFTSTVALLVCTTPILTALLTKAIWPDTRLSRSFFGGSLFALVGVSLVVFNGVFVLDDDPMVIALSMGASLLWAIYSIVLRLVEKRYNSYVITRKIFFWGVITLLPYFIYHPFTVTADVLSQPLVYMTLFFLAIIASLGCYLVWNIVISKIGVVVAGNYLYFNPVVSLFVAALVLGERITLLALIGCVLTILGVYLANKK